MTIIFVIMGITTIMALVMRTATHIHHTKHHLTPR
jgi:hypothetical protein